MGRDPRFRRLGDLAAGTIVVAEERARRRRAPAARPAAHRRPSCARLPQRVPLSGEELDAVELFLRRAGKLSARPRGRARRDGGAGLRPAHGRALQGRGAPAGVAPPPRPRAPRRAVPARHARRGRREPRAQDELRRRAIARLAGAGPRSSARATRSTSSTAPTHLARRGALPLALHRPHALPRGAATRRTSSRYLDGLAGRAHAALYGAPPFRMPGVIDFVARDFPRALRDELALLRRSPARSSSCPSLVGPPRRARLGRASRPRCCPRARWRAWRTSTRRASTPGATPAPTPAWPASTSTTTSASPSAASPPASSSARGASSSSSTTAS